MKKKYLMILILFLFVIAVGREISAGMELLAQKKGAYADTSH
jgi:hypothetical protein